MRENSLVKSLFGESLFDFPVDFSDFWNVKKQPVHGFVDLGDKYELNLTLPVIGDSLKVEVEDGMLEVAYNEKTEHGSYSGSYKFSLPEDGDTSMINAELGEVDDTTLTISIKKLEPKKDKPKRIEVTVK